jgi:hypothetical protein
MYALFAIIKAFNKNMHVFLSQIFDDMFVYFANKQ